MKRKYKEEKRLDDIHAVILLLWYLIGQKWNAWINFGFELKNITSLKENRDEEEKPLRFLKLIEKPVPRPPTPQIHVPDQVNRPKI